MQPAPAEFLCDKTLLGQGLLQAAQTITSFKLPVHSEGPVYHPMASLVMGLSPPHSVINVGDDKQEWLTLLHLIATHRPAHLQHDYTTILIQVGDVMPVKSLPAMRETVTMIMLGKDKQGKIWMEGAGTVPCPEVCRPKTPCFKVFFKGRPLNLRGAASPPKFKGRTAPNPLFYSVFQGPPLKLGLTLTRRVRKQSQCRLFFNNFKGAQTMVHIVN